MNRKLLLAALFAATLASAQRMDYGTLLGRHDRNNDGVLTKDEFNANPRLFDRFDANGDGTLTKAEFDEGSSKMAENLRNRPKGIRQPKAPEGATVHRDLEYAVEDGKPLKLDIYLPADTNATPPLIVWIHGGGWRSGDKGNVNGAVFRLLSDGYAIASINYRLKDLSIHPNHIHDCKGAVRWLRAHAGQYGYDPERVAVAGSSAGGHLALLLGLSSGVADLEGTVGGNTNQSSSVKAIIDFYGPSEFLEFSKTSDRFNSENSISEEQLRHASPLTYLTKEDPPVIIFHGDNDKTVPVGQSTLAKERYSEMGLEAELHVIEGAGHGGREFSDDERYGLIKAFADRHLKSN